MSTQLILRLLLSFPFLQLQLTQRTDVRAIFQRDDLVGCHRGDPAEHCICALVVRNLLTDPAKPKPLEAFHAVLRGRLHLDDIGVDSVHAIAGTAQDLLSGLLAVHHELRRLG